MEIIIYRLGLCKVYHDKLTERQTRIDRQIVSMTDSQLNRGQTDKEVRQTDIQTDIHTAT